MTPLISMTASLQCFVDGKPSTGSVLTLVLMLMQIAFGLIMRRRANFPGRRFFLIANAALAYWLMLATFEQWTQSPGCKIWFGALTHWGISLVPIAWVMFVYRYCYGIRGPVKTWQWQVMAGLPLTVVVIALTSSWHGLFYGPGTGAVNDLPGAAVQYQHGPLFAVSAVVLYSMLVLSLYLLSLGFFAARSSYRFHFGILLLLTLAPIGANLGYVLRGVAILDFDPTPFFFIFTSMSYAIIIMTNNYLDLVGVARKDFFDDFSTALAVIDTTGRTQSINRAATDVMALPGLAERLQEMIHDATVAGVAPADEVQISLGGRTLRICLHPVRSPLGRERRIIGWMATVEDVTAAQEMVADLTASLEERSTELKRTRAASRRLQSLSIRDPLTGALNRRGLEAALKSLLSDRKPTTDISMALADIDHFKQINDRYGHEAGDVVLVRFADILMSAFRHSDLLVRMGGEEFLVLGPGLDVAAMAQRLEEARRLLATDLQVLQVVPDLPVRFSAGLDRWTAEGGRAITEVRRSVDALLYTAKRDGRDRTVIGTGPDGAT